MLLYFLTYLVRKECTIYRPYFKGAESVSISTKIQEEPLTKNKLNSRILRFIAYSLDPFFVVHSVSLLIFSWISVLVLRYCFNGLLFLVIKWCFKCLVSLLGKDILHKWETGHFPRDYCRSHTKTQRKEKKNSSPCLACLPHFDGVGEQKFWWMIL